MERRLVAHPQNELDVILVRDHGRVRLVHVAVQFADERVRRRRVVGRIFGGIFCRWTVDAELRIFAGGAERLLEELVEVRRHDEREIEGGKPAHHRRRDLVHVDFVLDPLHQAIAREGVFIMPGHAFEIAYVPSWKSLQVFALVSELDR